MLNEAETCSEFVEPRLEAAGWTTPPHAVVGQYYFTDGRVFFAGSRVRRRKRKFADYLLRYTRDFPLAIVEAKRKHKTVETGLQQAMEYAEILKLPFAYATNGREIVEHDYLNGAETLIDRFPTPDELWQRYRAHTGLDDAAAEQLLTPYHLTANMQPRYYQEIAINRAVQAILSGKRRVLLTLATGTGKTMLAFQICWKLWKAEWNAAGARRPPRMLFLSDRNILVDDPYGKMFAPFAKARYKITGGRGLKSREMYFAIYQALAGTEGEPGLYQTFKPDFFDLIIVDECHRGSAREDSSWREILSYFAPAYQVGMTATPLREESRDTYLYFGNPIYEYSLADGIQDGFLAPYRLHRVRTQWDAEGWRPSPHELDRYGRTIPDGVYGTKDFERLIAMRARTEAVARHLTAFMRRTDRFAKTIVFCVDQEHASAMRRELVNLNADLVREYPDYVCRVTADEGEIGRGHLSRFQDVETRTPVILTTSQMLSTGVDMQTCKNVVLVRVVGSMAEFKQIIGRGTRLRPDYHKLYFNILDYTGSASIHFDDPAFDGFPAHVTEEEIDDHGNTTAITETPGPESEDVDYEPAEGRSTEPHVEEEGPPSKLYYDRGSVGIRDEVTSDLGPDGKKLAVGRIIDYAGERVRTLYPTADALRNRWANPDERNEVTSALEEHGVPLDVLRDEMGLPDADPFDLLCHLAYNAPLRTRRERAERLRREKRDFFERFGPDAQAILSDLLDQYTEHPTLAPFAIPDVLKVAPLSARGNVLEILAPFGSAARLREVVGELQHLLYAD